MRHPNMKQAIKMFTSESVEFGCCESGMLTNHRVNTIKLHRVVGTVTLMVWSVWSKASDQTDQ